MKSSRLANRHNRRSLATGKGISAQCSPIVSTVCFQFSFQAVAEKQCRMLAWGQSCSTTPEDSFCAAQTLSLLPARSPEKAKVKQQGRPVYLPGVKPDRINFDSGQIRYRSLIDKCSTSSQINSNLARLQGKRNRIRLRKVSEALTPAHQDA